MGRLLIEYPLWLVCRGSLLFSLGLNSFHKPGPNCAFPQRHGGHTCCSRGRRLSGTQPRKLGVSELRAWLCPGVGAEKVTGRQPGMLCGWMLCLVATLGQPGVLALLGIWIPPWHRYTGVCPDPCHYSGTATAVVTSLFGEGLPPPPSHPRHVTLHSANS